MKQARTQAPRRVRAGTVRPTQLVARVDDDNDSPVCGFVMWWEDADRCGVLWGDDRFAGDLSRARIEQVDQLRRV